MLDIEARQVAECLQNLQPLVDHPESGRVVPEFDQPFLREVIHPPFRLVYRGNSNK
jgi:plasmid stabilization system protein ParE